MPTYYSTCVSGLEAVAGRVAQGRMNGFRLLDSLSGAVVYTARNYKPVPDAFQNTYLYLRRYDRVRDMADAARRLLRDVQGIREADAAIKQGRFRTYRVMFSDGNALCAVDPNTRACVERMIRSAAVDRVKPEAELLLLRRTEGFALLLLRLTKATEARKNLNKGELSPALAQCMCYLARPSVEGLFCDPFAGHGALAKARLRLGPAAAVMASDIDAGLVEILNKELPKGVAVRRQDALRLEEYIKEETLTEIVADPPWGLYERLPLPPVKFYEALLAQFLRALKPGGRLVVLTADKESFERVFYAEEALRGWEKYDVLVNGKKAAVYACQKSARG